MPAINYLLNRHQLYNGDYYLSVNKNRLSASKLMFSSMLSKLLNQTKNSCLIFVFFWVCNLTSFSKFFQAIVCFQGHNTIDFPTFSVPIMSVISPETPMSVRCAFFHCPAGLSQGGHQKGGVSKETSPSVTALVSRGCYGKVP